MAITSYQSTVNALVRDDANRISIEQRDVAIEQAIIRYSKDRPAKKVEDVVAPGGNTLPLPSQWQLDFSQLKSVEYPLGRVPPNLISPQDFTLYDTPNGTVIMLRDALPLNEQVRLSYSVMHVVDVTDDTVPTGDQEAVCCLAAASLCDQLASFYSNDTDSTIKADSVNHQTKAAEFAARAKSLRKRYLDELGIDAKKNVAAGVIVGLESSNSLGRPLLTKRGAWRDRYAN